MVSVSSVNLLDLTPHPSPVPAAPVQEGRLRERDPGMKNAFRCKWAPEQSGLTVSRSTHGVTWRPQYSWSLMSVQAFASDADHDDGGGGGGGADDGGGGKMTVDNALIQLDITLE